MKRHTLVGLLSVVVAVGVVGGWTMMARADGCCGGAGNEMLAMTMASDGHAGHDQAETTAKVDTRKLADVATALGAVKKAIEAGDNKTALAELDKATKLLSAATAPQAGATTGAAAPKTASGQVVNTKCPIMGGTVNPAKVPASLTRDFKGQKVGFCCAMCPPQWDKLSAADKEAKLKAVVGS